VVTYFFQKIKRIYKKGANDMVKVQVKHLTKVFGKRSQDALKMVQEGRPKTEIVEKTGATVGVYDANFDVNEGEIFVIMGLSGSGKSTLIRLINRLIEPTSGDIYIDGKDIAKMDKDELREVRRRKMSMVFQNFGLFPHRTILENTEFGLEVRGVSKEERTALAEKALENSGLIAFKDQYPGQLSGGMQQRVGLARALANDPEILLMDEAFSALDPLIRREMQDELIDLQANVQKTIIFITHDLNEALRIGDRIALMKDGQIMQIGTGEEILTNPANDYVREFVEDVDRSKVLTASNIMVPALTTNIELDGPMVALQRMKTEEVSMLLAVDKKRQLRGYITADEAHRARKRGLSLKEVMTEEINTISKDMLVSDIFNVIYDSPMPLAVVENDRLLGVVIRGRVIEALAGTTDFSEEEEVLNA
jgi:glycine betaine/proline transport system ATP-binding protein